VKGAVVVAALYCDVIPLSTILPNTFILSMAASKCFHQNYQNKYQFSYGAIFSSDEMLFSPTSL